MHVKAGVDAGASASLPEAFTIGWLKEQYAAGKFTPEVVVSEIIRRSERDAAMNIWITPPSAGLIGPYVERLRTLDPADAPLWGIPFAIKDNIDLAGVPTTAACEPFAYNPSEHAVVVERLIAAGAIPVGKTNLDQFATGLVGTRSPYGETHNALRPELISGGSSSGSAVAVARGQAAFALGTDTAGSGRVPAALNRLVGYKPSLGAWPVKGVVPACESLDCVTVFASSLEDAYAVDQAARGMCDADPWSRSLPSPSSLRPSRLLVPIDGPEFFGPYAEGCEAAWNAVVKKLKGLEIPVEHVDTDLFEAAAELLYGGPWVAERWAGLGSFVEANPGATFPVTERVLRSGVDEVHTAAALFRAKHKLQRLKAEARLLLRDAVLALPTAGGTWTREQVRNEPLAANSAMGRYTNHCNLLDLCAVAIPAGDAAENVPFGITMFGLAEQESLIRGAAERFVSYAPSQGAAVETDSGGAKPVSFPSEDATLVAVCGLHMRGFALEPQMLGSGAVFVKETRTAARYSLLRLATTPAKPGLVRRIEGGVPIELELWAMPQSSFGAFVAAIPSPLGIGKIELEDGTEVPGFICEGYAATANAGAEDITLFGGWRRYVAYAGSIPSAQRS